MLNSKHFRYIDGRTVADVPYKLYQPIGYPLVLRSKKEDRDLGCIMINDIKRPLVKPFFTALPNNNTRYQMIFGNDNTELEFIITNLCHEWYIKFDIMRDDREINEVDPGGVNQVNEVRPLESYGVRADFTNGNRQIIIKKSDKKGEVVTLKQDEAAPASEKVGGYLYLTVTPREGLPELHEYFKETYWVVPDYVIVKNKTAPIYKHFDGFGGAILEGFAPPAAARGFGAVLEGFAPPAAGGFEGRVLEDLELGDVGNRRQARPKLGLPHKARAPEPDIFNVKLGNDGIDVPDDNGIAGGVYDSDEDLEEDAFISDDTHSKTSVAVEKPIHDHDLIGTSHVGKIIHGDKIVVNVGNTGVNYMYKLHSPPCVIGMSILDGVSVHVPERMSLADSKIIFDTFSNIVEKGLYADVKIFKEGACVVCMDESVNIVLLRCGHQCACSKECSDTITSRCPICNANVLKKVEASCFAN